MSAAEQFEAPTSTPPRRDALLEEEAFIESQLTQSPAKTSAKLRPLLALAPYVARYRGRAALAFISLTVAAITTLVVPIAVRRMIDFGFSPEGIALINSYFSVMIAIVAVLAAASASRYYLVMTIGERIVADIRRDVFAHLVSLSPAFLDSARRGELVSRLTAVATRPCWRSTHAIASRRPSRPRVPANTTTCPARATGRSWMAWRPRMPLCGGLTMGVESIEP